jgi:hypothetical protein
MLDFRFEMQNFGRFSAEQEYIKWKKILFFGLYGLGPLAWSNLELISEATNFTVSWQDSLYIGSAHHKAYLERTQTQKNTSIQTCSEWD